MTAVAPQARVGTQARRERTRKQLAGRRHLAGGVVWIVTVAALLAGVVAVNVAVLRLNLNLDGANRQRARLKVDIAALQAKIASTKRTEKIIQGAPGLVQADPMTTSIVNLPR